MSQSSGQTPASLRVHVGHREFVHANDTLEVVHQRFAAGRHDFMAVLDGRRLVGLCARRDLGTLLGARYGFALYARVPVRDHLTLDAIHIRADQPLTDVLQAISARRDEHFYDDVLLVDAAGDFLGLVYVRDLVRLQTSMLMGNIAEVADKNRQMEDDLRMAREVQVAMLPREFPACRADDGMALRFAQHYEPAGGVSGDFFDVLPVSDTAVGLIICDVMGHGVRSALITAMVRTMIEELRPHAAAPAEMLTQMNAHLSKLLNRAGDMIFVTAAYVVVDAANRRLSYAQAGHPTPLHWNARAGLAAPLGGADRIGGPALGLVEDHVYAQVDFGLEPDDRVLLFTDGIFEAANDAGEEFGLVRLTAALAQNAGSKLPALPAALRQAVVEFAGDRPFGDDVCLVACEVGK
jgi:phosphoserine phosphatase RsbU/P